MCLAVLAAISASAAPPASRSELTPGITRRAYLQSGRSHFYSIRLLPRQYIELVAFQTSADVALRVSDPDGVVVSTVDGPNGGADRETAMLVASKAGPYQAEIMLPANRRSGLYAIRLAVVRPVTDADDRRVLAEAAFEEGESRRIRSRQEWPQAAVLYATARTGFEKDGPPSRVAVAVQRLAEIESVAGRRVELLQLASTLYRRAHWDRSAAWALRDAGAFLYSTGQYSEAIPLLQSAASIFRRTIDQLGFASALRGLGSATANTGRYDEGLRDLHRSAAISNRIGDQTGRILALMNIGRLYARMEQHAKALPYSERALSIARRIGDKANEATLLNNLGAQSYLLGRHRDSVVYYGQSLAIARTAKNRGVERLALVNLGSVYQVLAEYGKAIAHYEGALRIAEELREPANQRYALTGLGITYEALGDYAQAMATFERALLIARGLKDRRIEAVLLRYEGVSAEKMGQRARALSLYEQSLTIAVEIKERREEAALLERMGALETGMGRPANAIGPLERALPITRSIKDRQTEAKILTQLGRAHSEIGNLQRAEQYLLQSLAVFTEIGYRRGESEALTELMNAWSKASRPDLAIFFGKRAVDVLQSIRRDIQTLSVDAQQTFVSSKQESYRRLADLLLSQGRLPEAEQILRLLKDSEYRDFVRGEVETDVPNARPSLSDLETAADRGFRDIGARIVTAGEERGKLVAKASLNDAETRRLQQLETQLQKSNTEFQQLLDRLKDQFASRPNLAVRLDQIGDASALMEDLRELPAGTVAIYTLITPDRVRSILITPDVQKSYEVPISSTALNAKILEFRQAVQDEKADPRPLGRELYDVLFRNIDADLKDTATRMLMWSLDGPLRYVPVAALFDGKQYLIERYGMSVFTPASNARLKDRPTSVWSAAGFGVSKSVMGAAALPAVEQELNGIIHEGARAGGVMEGTVKLNEQFTVEAMRSVLLGHPAVIHIASHFYFEAGNETTSFLLMGDGSRLAVSELKSLPALFSGVQLLTLSACNTGMGGSADGKEIEGFATVAQKKGAKAVLATLWPVADVSTSLLMPRMYQIRKANPQMAKAQALREAQLALLRGGMIPSQSAVRRGLINPGATTQRRSPDFVVDPAKPFAHPFFWAPFILIGNWL